MSDKLGVDNLLKVVDGLGKTLAIGGDVLADGKISFSDLFKLPELIAAVNGIVVAAKEAPAEVKDMDATELQMVVAALVAAIGKVVGKK